MSAQALLNEIQELKIKRNALILAHYYEDGDIQDIADAVGDSLFLAQEGEKAKNPVVLLAGVTFMAESVKILSPDKTVLVPDPNAGCSLVDHSPYEKYLAWRRQHPDAIAVTYVNSSAAVKSITDVCVTSSNAEKIVNAIPRDREILFGPDRNLGRYLSKKLDRPMTLWPGSCEVHVLFSSRKLHELKLEHPHARVIAHPECNEVVLEHADVIGSTSRLLQEVRENRAVNEFIVATEPGIFHQMKKARPDARLYQAPAEGSCACNECPYMKMNTLAKIRDALRDLKPNVQIEADLLSKARISLDRMMALTRGESVTWPERFNG
ncbi:MAG: quinolinate synthase NadA [Bdellovibrionaceae bacterium]|nr:quinolinate synthase NadA [Pseudobdellovibrionaceae bacterium]